jgi:hypothetical protein
MERLEAILAELEQMREGAAALIRAKLEAVARQTRELAARLASDLDVVVPPDLEALFPIGAVAEHLQTLSAPPPPLPTLGLEAIRRLDAGRAQSEVLQELLRQLGPWCGPRAIIVVRDGVVQGWSGAGFPVGDPARSWRASVAESPALAKASAGSPVLVRAGDDAVLSSWFEGGNRRLLLVPMLLRGKVVGILLALEGEAGLNTGLVQQLNYTVGLMLETLATRPTIPNPALVEPEDLTAEVAQAPEPQPVMPVPLPEIPEEVPSELQEEPELAPETPPPAVGVADTVHLRVPVTPAVPVMPLRTPEEERKHEEARRFARLLVSEIRLYNEQAVQAGKLAHDIYRRLKEDIDRSRDMYEQRVSAEVRADSNYFHDEMVRILADGDPKALGM